jgi:hypothetical protein
MSKLVGLVADLQARDHTQMSLESCNPKSTCSLRDSTYNPTWHLLAMVLSQKDWCDVPAPS